MDKVGYALLRFYLNAQCQCARHAGQYAARKGGYVPRLPSIQQMQLRAPSATSPFHSKQIIKQVPRARAWPVRRLYGRAYWFMREQRLCAVSIGCGCAAKTGIVTVSNGACVCKCHQFKLSAGADAKGVFAGGFDSGRLFCRLLRAGEQAENLIQTKPSVCALCAMRLRCAFKNTAGYAPLAATGRAQTHGSISSNGAVWRAGIGLFSSHSCCSAAASVCHVMPAPTEHWISQRATRHTAR